MAMGVRPNSLTRVAVIGTGSAGQRHLKVLRGIETVEPIAVPKRAARVQEMERVGYLSAGYLDGAVQIGANLSIVASDTGEHLRDGLAALEAGLDVLMEKPMAIKG